MKSLEDVRREQADRLYGLHWDLDSRDYSFLEYLSIVPPLAPCRGDASTFDKPVLIDQTLSIPRTCQRLNIDYACHRRGFVNRNRRRLRPPVLYWIWCNDGSDNIGLSPLLCRWTLDRHEFGLTAEQGIAFHAHYPSVAMERFIDLPGSSPFGDSSFVACLGPWDISDGVRLHYVKEWEHNDECGSGTFTLPRQTERQPASV